MGGGLMQLVAYGAQDVYLTGNPQVTFFKVVYRRHTNFSVEPIQQVFNGSPDFGRTVTATINRNGDLITNMYAVVELKEHTDTVNWGYVRRLGYALIGETKVEIGGSKIDEQYGDWLNIWYELSHKVGQERGHAEMIGDTPDLCNLDLTHDAKTLFVPLNFWFNRFNGLALPLIALQYHDVRISIDYRKFSECVNYEGDKAPATNSMDSSYLLIDYVYLDSEERKRFAQASHEYLIEQLQFTGSESLSSNNNKYRLNFNHPSKFLVWGCHLEQFSKPTQYPVYATDGDWAKALDDLAKKIWYIVRMDTTDAFVAGTAQEPAPFGSIANELATLVTAQMIDDGANTGDNDGVQTWRDVVLISNKLTNDALSYTVAELINGIDTLVYSSKLAEWFSNTLVVAGNDADKGDAVTVQDHFNYGTNLDCTNNPVNNAKLQLNGHDRFQAREGAYFNYVQPYQHFSNTPADGINVYSFALKPEDIQPSGTCNFSRIDNATLNVTVKATAKVGKDLGKDSVVNIFVVNYNVLRVMSGMAGTAYSN